MNELDPAVWSKAFFKTHSKSDSLENNMSECFNSWILKARYMPLIEMLTEIHDMIMTRLHEKRDWMKQYDCVIVPVMKRNIDEAIKKSLGYSSLWDGRETYVVKGHEGSSVSVNLQHMTCSCRVWELTGVPCAHAVNAIQQSRQNPLDFVEKWFTKQTYLQTYSHTLEVLKGEEYWEDVMGDLLLPPLLVKRLRGRPKKQRRREGWEGTVSSGKKSRVSYKGRVMHCGYCRQEGHKRTVCPDKDMYEQELARKASQPKKRGRKNKEKEVADEAHDEERAIEKERETGEDILMEEAMRDFDDLPLHVLFGDLPPHALKVVRNFLLDAIYSYILFLSTCNIFLYIIIVYLVFRCQHQIWTTILLALEVLPMHLPHQTKSRRQHL